MAALAKIIQAVSISRRIRAINGSDTRANSTMADPDSRRRLRRESSSGCPPGSLRFTTSCFPVALQKAMLFSEQNAATN
jgi:hypothetical protein